MNYKLFSLALCTLFAFVSSYGTSHVSVSNPHHSKYSFGINHAYHGQWSGASFPHGYGGLGAGYGGYQGGLASYGGIGGIGGFGGYGATSYANSNIHSYLGNRGYW